MGGALPDDFWIDWHPTRSVLDDVADAEWQFLTGSIRELDVGHGYQRDIGRVEAGQLLAVVDNRSRNLDPTNRQSTWWPNLGPLRHVRVCATSGGTTYVIWRGFSTSFDPHWSINDAWVVIEGYDSLMAAARVISESVFQTAIAESDPDIWLPLGDGGATTAQGRGRSPSATAVSTLKGEPILPYADTPSTRFPYAGGQGSRAEVILNTPAFQVNPAGFTVAAAIKTSPGTVQTILSAGPNPPAAASPAGDVAFYLEAGGSYSLWVGNAAGHNIGTIDGQPGDASTFVLALYDPATIGIEATIGLRNIGGAGFANVGVFAPRAGAVRIGAALDPANAFPFTGNLSHVMLWNRVLSDPETQRLQRAYRGRVAYTVAGGLSNAHHVIGWVLDRLGIPVGRRAVDAGGSLVLGATKVGIAAIEMMSRAAATEGGYFFADRSGDYVFRLRGYKGADRGTYDTRPGTTDNAALADLTFANDDRSFFTVAKMHVATGIDDGQDVVYRHPNAERFDEVVYDALTQFDNVADAHVAGVAQVGDATPRIDVTEAVVQMGAPGVDAERLLGSDILDEATMVARIPDDAGPGPFMTWDTKTPARWPQIDSNTRNDLTGRVGVKFTAPAVGPLADPAPAVLSLGRRVAAGNVGAHTLELWRVATNTLLASVVVTTAGKPVGEYSYTALGAPVTLSPGEAYYILSTETAAGDLWYNDNSGTGAHSKTASSDEAIAAGSSATVSSVAGAGAVGPWTEPGGGRSGYQSIGWLVGSSLTGGLPFWGGPAGWAGPPPHTQRSTILFVGHTYDRSTHAWRTRWSLTPS